MSPIFVATLIGAVYLLGTRMGRRKGASEAATPQALPSPPEGGASPWESVNFDVDVFPAGAPLGALLPPARSDGISIAADCSAIAVGRAFWSRLTALAAPLVEQGMAPDDVLIHLRFALFPTRGPRGRWGSFHACLARGRQSALLLQEEMLERIQAIGSPGVFGLSAGVPIPIPTKNWRAP